MHMSQYSVMYPQPIILLGTPEGTAVVEKSSRIPHSVPISQGGTLGAYGPPQPRIYPEKTVKAVRAAQARAPLIATGNRSYSLDAYGTAISQDWPLGFL